MSAISLAGAKGAPVQPLRAKKHLLALAVAAALAGCGGGEDTASVMPAAPQAAAPMSALAAQSPAASTVAPEEAARQLMDFAESTFPAYFPGHKTTQSLAPFVYRYYPETGIYLGVVVTAGGGYELNGVYVLGGAFGASPLYVGPLTTFITPVGSGTGTGTGANNGCYDLALGDTQGTRSVVAYTYTGTITGTQTVTSVVGGIGTFEGVQARETAATTTGSNTIAGTTVALNTENKYYFNRTGDSELTQYGGVTTATSSVAGFNILTTIKSVFSPPWVSRQFTLGLGESLTETLNSVITTTISGFGAPVVTPSNFSYTSTTKYVGRETITVPAGTYSTCKFEVTSGSPSTLTTNWSIVGNGLLVQTVSGGQTIKATSVQLNGSAI